METYQAKVMPVTILALLLGLFCCQGGWAADVGVLVDVSGSLRSLPVEDGQNLLIRLIVNGQIQSPWQELSANDDFPVTKAIRNHQPLINPGDRLLTMTFGSVKNPKWPYFTPPRVSPVSSLDEVSSRIRAFYPKHREDRKDEYTYIDLALAVASEEMKKNGAKEWLLVILSDFQESKILNRNLTPEQLTLEKDFLAEKTMEHKIPVHIGHGSNQLLQVRIYNVQLKGKTDPDPKPECQEGFRVIAPKGEIEETKPTFRWQRCGEATSYVLRCLKGEEAVIKEKVAGLQFQPKTDLPGGAEYKWQVIAHLPDGRTVPSERAKFKIKDSGKLSLLLALLGLIGLGAGVYYRKELLALVGFPPKKTGTS